MRREENVVVHHIRAVTYLDKEVLTAIIVNDIRRNTRSLRHPVEPDAEVARFVNAIVVDISVDRTMQLNARHFSTAKLLLGKNVIDVIAVDFAESGTHTATDTGLFAVGDYVVAHDVRTDVGFVPAFAQYVENHLDVVQSAIQALVVALQVVTTAAFLAQSDAIGTRIFYNIVFDNPTFVPVSRHHAHLFGSRRSPLSGGLIEYKAANGDVIQSLASGVEASGANRHFSDLLIRVDSAEIGINSGVFGIHFGKPHIGATFGVANGAQRVGA